MENSNAVVDIRSAAEAGSAEKIEDTLCMRCGNTGTTTLLLTKIPHFRELVLMAFECPHCNERNNEVQFVGQLQPRGCVYELKVQSGDAEVLNRQVVKSDSATIKIPELDFEIPPEAQRGTLSTVEGILLRAVNELESLQDERKKLVPETAEAIDQFLIKLRSLAAGNTSFTFILDDPSGNSFVENPCAPSLDPLLSIKFYERTREQQESLGFLADPSLVEEENVARDVSTEGNNLLGEGTQVVPHGSVGAVAGRRAIAQANSDEVAAAFCRYSAPEEVETLPSTCSTCGTACVCRFYATKIPYFREVIVMASSCDVCGYRSSEVKAGGEVPKKGKKIIVSVRSMEDLSRDVIKADTASVSVPEVELELTSGTLGGLVTTIEGLITKIGENLERVHGFSAGDSVDEWRKKKWQDFQSKLKKLLNLEEPWTLIIDDAMASSFVSPTTDVIEDDKKLVVEEYERTWEQNEELGLNDMDTSSADIAYDTAEQ